MSGTKRSREEPEYFGVMLMSQIYPTQEVWMYYTEYQKVDEKQQKLLTNSTPSSRLHEKIIGCGPGRKNEFTGWKTLKTHEEIEQMTSDHHVCVTIAWRDE